MLDLGTLRLGIKVDSDSAKSELNQVGGAVEGTGSKVADLASKAKMMIKAFAAAWAVKEIVKLGKAALDAYAKYEQLEGGVKKLFGEEGSEYIMKYAQNAYKTAGISANEYMEQATSFSASLIKSLNGDTVKAAQITDMAIQDMADNANVFGSDMASIQQAYQGFAKGQYTLLDNLKLGYGGTKTEMERLLEDAEKLSGQEYDISNLNDVYEAIHVIQQEMEITGTTAREAASTIEGSTAQMKASWQNLLTAIGRGKGVEEAVDNFIKSLGTVAKNVGPVAVRIMQALALALVKAGFYLVQAGAKAMKQFVQGFMDNHPQIVAAVQAIGDAFNTFFSPVISIIKTVIKWWKTLTKQRANKKFTVSAPFAGAISSIKNVYNRWKSVLGQKAKKTFTIVKSGFSSAVSSMKSVLSHWKSILSQKARKVFTIVNERVGGGGAGHRIGLREVPYDGYVATLHKGETILTAAETNAYKKLLEAGGGKTTVDGDNITINVYGSNNMSVQDLARAVEQRMTQTQKRRMLAWQ